ncbi:NUDIX hydrolase [Paenibacillus montanisoli]|uniref:DNA mismatch repair protein MutT n=1 Tax=Paenibacillus montanisoli TaxID=2081970 RepID=A0A328UDB9_9BACL|nr:8-oxo-dGTP diphosphatase [Paenibacillus montanisoli]RAP78334.1 DNA mismatch repair protein MutT [Paenibacillus montanisoli]
MYTYTICFIEQGSRLLMLNRNKPPAMGLWNGVGGKLEPGETPLACVEREVFEETGLRLTSFRYRGIVSWRVDEADIGGMHVFCATLPEHAEYDTPVCIDEGLLEWKEKAWVLTKGNYGVGVIIPEYLPAVLSDEPCYEHKCVLHGNRLTAYEAVPIAVLELSTHGRK